MINMTPRYGWQGVLLSLFE